MDHIPFLGVCLRGLDFRIFSLIIWESSLATPIPSLSETTAIVSPFFNLCEGQALDDGIGPVCINSFSKKNSPPYSLTKSEKLLRLWLYLWPKQPPKRARSPTVVHAPPTEPTEIWKETSFS